MNLSKIFKETAERYTDQPENDILNTLADKIAEAELEDMNREIARQKLELNRANADVYNQIVMDKYSMITRRE